MFNKRKRGTAAENAKIHLGFKSGFPQLSISQMTHVTCRSPTSSLCLCLTHLLDHQPGHFLFCKRWFSSKNPSLCSDLPRFTKPACFPKAKLKWLMVYSEEKERRPLKLQHWSQLTCKTMIPSLHPLSYHAPSFFSARTARKCNIQGARSMVSSAASTLNNQYHSWLFPEEN